MNKAFSSQTELPLWPGAAPGSEGLSLDEIVDERSPDPDSFGDRAVSAITRPTLTAFRPAQANGTSILIAPGGGYQRIVVDKEGSELARWLNSLGVTAFVLKYRLPGEGHAQAADVPLQDAQRALRIVRARAAEWGLAGDRIGVLGCSAGGHVMASLATRHAQTVYRPVDHTDAVSARPDFVALLYPVITMAEPFAHAGSRRALLGEAPEAARVAAYSCEQQVDADTPPVFLSLASDDASVPAENAVAFYHALRRAHVSAALHIFEKGGHGHALRNARGPVEAWPTLLADWLRAYGWLA